MCISDIACYTSKTYSLVVVIFESSHFEAIREGYLNDNEYALLQRHLVLIPDVGSLIKGSGGTRKLRWLGQGKGKRGGLRVIYYWLITDDQILMLDIYGKGEKTDLTADEIKAIRKLVKSL